MKNIRYWLYFIPAFLFITAFQNCSVYQTGGRKYVENGTAKQAKDLSQSQSQNSAKIAHTCAPYLNNEAASAAMGTQVSTKLVLDESNSSVSCVVSTEEISHQPALDVAVCSISADNLQLLYEAPDQTMVLDPLGPLSRGSFGFSKTLSNGLTQFIFVGASQTALEAVACQFTFSSQEDYFKLSDQVLERGARLVHEIAPKLR